MADDEVGDSGDSLVKDDSDNLAERVEKLEKKCLALEDENMCLKSALADVTRRVKQMELDSCAAPHSSTPTSKRTAHSVTKRTTTTNHHEPSPHRSSPVHQRSSPANQRVTPKSASRLNKPNMRPWASTEIRSSSETHHGSRSHNKDATMASRKRDIGPMAQSKRMGSSKPPSWNADGGSLKIYLKGRPIILYAPSQYADYEPHKELAQPDEKLRLDWVYGYRGRDCRSNLYYLPTGEIVYFVAATAILFNPEEHSQRHYTGHNDDIKCLAISPDKVHIATGQVAGHDKKEGKAHVRIWHSVTLNTVHVIGFGDFERAVTCISFSKHDGGKQLVAVDDANDHYISVWDISRAKAAKIVQTKSSADPVLAVEYHPVESNCIVSCGKGHIAFWTLDGCTLNKKLGLFDKYEKPKYVLCLAFTDEGDVLSGDSSGNIFTWKRLGNQITRAIVGAHDGGVFSLLVTPEGSILSGGGKDRRIIEWDSDLKKTGLETQIDEEYGGVRVLTQRRGNLLLVGCTKNYILQGPRDFSLNPIVFGHTDELWGLAMHPTHHQFITCAYDKHLFMWDALSHTVVWGTELPDEGQCCCFHPEHNIACIGLRNATWLVLDLTSRDVISSHSDGNEQIEAVQYSPDGHFVALGSRDNNIYVYRVSDDGTRYTWHGKCSGHSSFITHLDWSTDSAYIRSNSGDYELLYWSAEDCKQETSFADLKDVKWVTQNCTLDFTVAGIWGEGADGTDINTCARSNKQLLVVTGDDFGKVNLFTYPCAQPKATANSFSGHSSHVTNVVFTPDDTRVITTGGKDTAILQWAIV